MDQKTSAHSRKSKIHSFYKFNHIISFFLDSNPFLPSTMFIETKLVHLTFCINKIAQLGMGNGIFERTCNFSPKFLGCYSGLCLQSLDLLETSEVNHCCLSS